MNHHMTAESIHSFLFLYACSLDFKATHTHSGYHSRVWGLCVCGMWVCVCCWARCGSPLRYMIEIDTLSLYIYRDKGSTTLTRTSPIGAMVKRSAVGQETDPR